MSNFELSEYIEKPQKDVFEMIANPANAAKFMDNIKESKKLTEGPTKAGTRFKETRLMNGKEATAELEVTVYEPPTRFGVKTETEGIKVQYDYHLTPEGKGTRVNWVCELEAKGLRRMMLPMVATIMKKEDGDHLRKLKQMMER